MKTWQKILATVGIVFVMCALDVVRKANGVVLGGLPTMIFYGVFLAAIGVVWKSKTKPNEKNDDAAVARKILEEREKEREQEAKRIKIEHKAQRDAELRSLPDDELRKLVETDEKEKNSYRAADAVIFAVILIAAVFFIIVLASS